MKFKSFKILEYFMKIPEDEILKSITKIETIIIHLPKICSEKSETPIDDFCLEVFNKPCCLLSQYEIDIVIQTLRLLRFELSEKIFIT